MVNPRDVISSIIFYGGLILALTFIVRIGRTYSWTKVDEEFKLMEPALARGHYFWVNKRGRHVSRLRHNDVIMFHRPPWKRVNWTYEFGRIIGLPGDLVKMRYGKVYRAERTKQGLSDSEMVTEHYVPLYQRPHDFSEFMVPRNAVFVLFDQRHRRPALRDLIVPERAIVGKVIREEFSRVIRFFRLTPTSAASLALSIVLCLVGLLMLLGTIDEYRAGRAFDRAMAAYSARDIETVHAALDEAIAAKTSYAAPQEVKGKLFIDEGVLNVAQYDEARDVFKHLADATENARRPDGHTGPTLPVLVGRAVAELEADRARSATGVPSTRAVAEARRRLERAAEEYPDSGDLYVNLASVALHEGNVPQCRQYLDKVREVGNLSIDALPYLYNLRGMVELREGRFPVAVLEFKVAEFRPEWSVPRLNLAAAYAQSLLRGQLDPGVAHQYATTIRRILGDLQRARSPLVAPICHSLAVHYIRQGEPGEALTYFKKAEEQGDLGWHQRLNRAIAYYLAGVKERPDRPQRGIYFRQAQSELEKAVGSRLLTSRDKFAAYCILGTVRAQSGGVAEGIADFRKAEALASRTTIPDVRKGLPLIQRNLAALYFATNEDRLALEYLEKSKDLDDPRGQAGALLAQLRTRPEVNILSTRVDHMYTAYDLYFHAQIKVLSTTAQLDPEKDVALILHNALTGEERPMPFVLDGIDLRSRVVNLPQGRFTCRLAVTDHVGNKASATSEVLSIDREPPRCVKIEPASDKPVAGPVTAIKFLVMDAISKPDLATLSVMVRYPDTTGGQHAIVSRGKYRYRAADGSVAVNDPVTEKVAAPLPRPAKTPGAYAVMVRVSDILGKPAEISWTFTIR